MGLRHNPAAEPWQPRQRFDNSGMPICPGCGNGHTQAEITCWEACYETARPQCGAEIQYEDWDEPLACVLASEHGGPHQGSSQFTWPDRT